MSLTTYARTPTNCESLSLISGGGVVVAFYCSFLFISLFLPVITIIIAVNSATPYLIDKGEHTMLYKINKNVYIKS